MRSPLRKVTTGIVPSRVPRQLAPFDAAVKFSLTYLLLETCIEMENDLGPWASFSAPFCGKNATG